MIFFIHTDVLFQVDSKSRYMSVLCHKLSEDDGCELSQDMRKISTAELPQDRVSYFHQLQSLLKNGTQEVIHQRQVTHFLFR